MVNGKQYVGQTSRTLEQRWREHCTQKTCIIDKIIKRYGKENFSIIELDRANTLDELNDKEIFYINKLKTRVPNGYNVAFGGSGVPVEKTEEWKRKIGIANKNNKRPDLATYNSTHKNKPIVQLSLDNKELKLWSSSREIESAGIGNHSLILKICNGDPKRHTAYGYKWRYATDMEVKTGVV